MGSLSYKKSIVAVVTIAIVFRTLYRFLAWRKKKKPAPKQIDELITFSETAELTTCINSLLRTRVPPSSDRILYYLNEARYSLDVCMYMLTSRDISYMIQKLHYRGVKIRYIVDANYAFANKSETKRLYKQDAVELRWMRSKHIMHHKFCIIDASTNAKDERIVPFVMTGSLNWTNQALNGNWESVVVTSEPKIVQLYKNEFERLWEQFVL